MYKIDIVAAPITLDVKRHPKCGRRLVALIPNYRRLVSKKSKSVCLLRVLPERFDIVNTRRYIASKIRVNSIQIVTASIVVFRAEEDAGGRGRLALALVAVLKLEKFERLIKFVNFGAGVARRVEAVRLVVVAA